MADRPPLPRLDELARQLAPLVLAEIAKLAAKASTPNYSSRKHCGAPGLSDEENKRIARLIGTKRGRWHVYTAEQLAQYERSREDARPAEPRPAETPAARSWHPSMSAEMAGLRVVKGGGR
jgi:hypothetical protein